MAIPVRVGRRRRAGHDRIRRPVLSAAASPPGGDRQDAAQTNAGTPSPDAKPESTRPQNARSPREEAQGHSAPPRRSPSRHPPAEAKPKTAFQPRVAKPRTEAAKAGRAHTGTRPTPAPRTKLRPSRLRRRCNRVRFRSNAQAQDRGQRTDQGRDDSHRHPGHDTPRLDLDRGRQDRGRGAGLESPIGYCRDRCPGLVAMPGIIDTHSHIAIQGGVNEHSLSIVPEVRVKDVVTGDDISIYRALAGGTTTARLLHGSANTIGGQDAVIKLRYGKPGRDLIIRDAPQGVKFALGENVTRQRGRFPNTRMGVQSVIEQAFEEAQAYRAEWDRHEAARKKDKDQGRPAPRTDLRLEALVRILDGSIKIHCHCYRGDEILMLLSTAERYGIKVQSLQHVLEGYKVAAEIALHGASCSTFSDWWAHKVEAYDAIPYNAALLSRAGADVCIKSDSEELIRHLNLEAAKIVKYGGVTEAQALAMITINPARQLGLDVGWARSRSGRTRTSSCSTPIPSMPFPDVSWP